MEPALFSVQRRVSYADSRSGVTAVDLHFEHFLHAEGAAELYRFVCTAEALYFLTTIFNFDQTRFLTLLLHFGSVSSRCSRARNYYFFLTYFPAQNVLAPREAFFSQRQPPTSTIGYCQEI